MSLQPTARAENGQGQQQANGLNKQGETRLQRPIMFPTCWRTSQEQGNNGVSTEDSGSLNKASASQLLDCLSQGRGGDDGGEKFPGKYFQENSRRLLPVASECLADELAGGEAVGRDPAVGREGPDISLAASQAPELCNTGAMNRQEGKVSSDSGRETGGFDTLHVCLYGEWDESRFDELWVGWDAARDAAENGDEAGSYWEGPDGDRWKLQASGAFLGCYCRWVAEWNGCRLYVVNRQAESASMLAVFVQIGSLALMTRGHKAVWEDCRRMLAAIGFRVSRHVISRADVCVDLPGVDVTEFTRPALNGHEITRAKRGTLHFGETASDHETLYRGGQRVMMRIYDKRKETRFDPAKEAVLIEKRWGGELPEAATRVEFQLGRELLKERWEIHTFDDLEAKGPQLVTWLTTQWYRLAECVVDRENRNHSRASTAAVWQRVCEAFAWVGRNTIPTVLPRKVLQPKAEQLLKQALGCFAGYQALLDRAYGDAVDAGEHLMDLAACNAERLLQLIGVKRELYGVKLGQAVAGVGGAPF
jgi:hypothetical protein